MTLRELGDQFSSFLSTQMTVIESLGSKNIMDWPIGYTILAGVVGFILMVYIIVYSVRILEKLAGWWHGRSQSGIGATLSKQGASQTCKVELHIIPSCLPLPARIWLLSSVN